MAFRTTLFLLGRIRGYGSATSYQSLLSRGCRTGLKRLLRSFVPKAQVAARSTSTVQPRMPNVIPDIAFLSFGTDANYAISKHGILDHIQKSMTPIHPPPRPAVLPRPPLSDDDAKGLGRGVEKYLNGAKLDVPAAYIEVLKYTNPTEVRDYHVVFDAQVEDLVVSSVVSRCREVVNILYNVLGYDTTRSLVGVYGSDLRQGILGVSKSQLLLGLFGSLIKSSKDGSTNSPTPRHDDDEPGTSFMISQPETLRVEPGIVNAIIQEWITPEELTTALASSSLRLMNDVVHRITLKQAFLPIKFVVDASEAGTLSATLEERMGYLDTNCLAAAFYFLLRVQSLEDIATAVKAGDLDWQKDLLEQVKTRWSRVPEYAVYVDAVKSWHKKMWSLQVDKMHVKLSDTPEIKGIHKSIQSLESKLEQLKRKDGRKVEGTTYQSGATPETKGSTTGVRGHVVSHQRKRGPSSKGQSKRAPRR